MVTAFCPGHITCFFQPVRTDDVLTTGSRGVGIRLSKGARVTLEERSDDRLITVMDGTGTPCPVTADAVRRISGRGFDITIENDLPVGQGFGMSAAGAIAAAMCACVSEDKDHAEAFAAAHISEVVNGGGLGDVSAISCPSHIPIRSRAGLPPYGKVIGADLRLPDLRLLILDGPLDTGSVLSDPVVSERIAYHGSSSVDSFIMSPSVDSLFALARAFTADIGLATEGMTDIMDSNDMSSMCMLGHSIFTLDDIEDSIPCPSTDIMPFICRG